MRENGTVKHEVGVHNLARLDRPPSVPRFNQIELSRLPLLTLSFPISWRNTSSMSSTSTPDNVDDPRLLYHTDLLLLSIVGLFFIVRLPRIIALFGTTSEWFDGHILRYIPYRPSTRVVQSTHRSRPPPSPKEYASDNSHTLYSHASHASHAQRVTEKGAPVTMHYPPHVASCIKFLRPFLKLLRLRISPGFSIAQSFILSVYFSCLVYASFYKSNIFTDNSRTGWVAIAQLPFVFAFSQKNNMIGSLLGYGYEKVNHRQRPTKIYIIMLKSPIYR